MSFKDFKLGCLDDSKHYTMRELKAIHDDYVSKGGFVGLMSRSTPYTVQKYVYRGMRYHSYLNFFEDIKIVIERRKLIIFYPYLALYTFLAKIEEYFCSGRKRNKEKRKEKRIRKEMLKAGCYVGTGDYYQGKR